MPASPTNDLLDLVGSKKLLQFAQIPQIHQENFVNGAVKRTHFFERENQEVLV
jgi:hypothetical protein